MVEIAETAGISITSDEIAIAASDPVRAACELLGFNPLHVAHEGRFVVFVAPEETERALASLRRHTVSGEAAVIGQVRGVPAGLVSCRGPFGTERAIDMLSGEQLPRIY